MTAGAITLRRALPGDRAALSDVMHRAAWANPGDRAFLAAHPLATEVAAGAIDAGHVHLAQDRGVPLGFAELLPPKRGVAEIAGLFVDPDHWRRGIARRLVTQCETLAAALGATRLRTVANRAALAFWTAVGFVQTGTAPVATGTAPVLEKPLTRSLA